MIFPTYTSWQGLPASKLRVTGVIMYSTAGWGTYNYLLRRLRHIKHDD